ncbi:hypothetical protein [Aeromonas caviae]|uniref:hypothetical protein n=1 Tax=Aeromonas caviae TaxID=648 RepID=UPI001CC77EAE|nr:hypothetical protein [Aeromonas caviae]GJA18881.1 hypothetical protein KAM336_19020 [Aeromonas caviae]GJA27482.1 hypothetical protein KAM340_16490 [Aeromonas caviae]GJB18464.1 hypothetical protein KAM364_03760 [Aeromonas caviae]
MSKKEKAAPQNGTTKLEPGQHITKHELVATHLLEQGAQGVSALSGLAGLHDLNMRNSISLLRRNHGIAIADAFFEHRHTGGGITRLKRYWLADRAEARKVAELVNLKRRQRNALPMEPEQIACYLAAFPATPDELPPAA